MRFFLGRFLFGRAEEYRQSRCRNPLRQVPLEPVSSPVELVSSWTPQQISLLPRRPSREAERSHRCRNPNPVRQVRVESVFCCCVSESSQPRESFVDLAAVELAHVVQLAVVQLAVVEL